MKGEIEMAEKTENKKKKTGSGGGPKIILKKGPTRSKDKVEITLYIITLDAKGQRIDTEVEVFNDDGISQGTVITAKGKAEFTYQPPLNKTGKEINPRAESVIEGRHIESTPIAILVPELTGLTSGISWIRYNWRIPLIATGKAIIALIVAWFFLSCVGEGDINIIFGIILGILGFLRFRQKSFITSLVLLIGLPMLCIIFRNLITGPLWYGVYMSFLVGGIAFWVEGVMPRRPKDGKPYINIYPWYPLAFIALGIVMNLIEMFEPFLSPAASSPSPESLKVIKMSPEASGSFSMKAKNDNGFFLWLWSFIPFIGRINIQSAGESIKDIFELFFFGIILLIYAGPQDIIGMFTGKKQGIGGTEKTEKAFFLVEIAAVGKWAWNQLRGFLGKGKIKTGGKK